MEIEGDTLNLLHFAEGDVLKVHGDGRENANLQLGELVLIGPKVLIDQRENRAWIQGVGLMHMPSNTTFDGGKPNKPGTRMTNKFLTPGVGWPRISLRVLRWPRMRLSERLANPAWRFIT